VPSSLALVPSLETTWQDVDSSFERFCLTAGIIQINGLYISNDLVLVAARGIDADGHKHPLGLVEEATSDRARARSHGLPAVYHRRRQGAE
jgi:hypothetical protein